MAARLAVIGGGRMGEALTAGLLVSGWAPPGAITVVEASATRRRELAARFPTLVVAESLGSAEGVVLAVKPGDVEAACGPVRASGAGRVLSIAAGVTLDSLHSWLGDEVAVVRAMPNTPALVGAGAAAIAARAGVGEPDLAWAEGILSAVGVVERVGEQLLDAVTGLSGSGPAYVFLVAEALIEAGVLAGLSRPVSRSLVAQTILGSARMLVELGDEPEVLRANVTSPGGTTAAGLGVLEARAVRSAFLEAVTAATDRSRELGHQ